MLDLGRSLLEDIQADNFASLEKKKIENVFFWEMTLNFQIENTDTDTVFIQ